MHNGTGNHGRTGDPKRRRTRTQKSAPRSCARQPNARGGMGGAFRAARLRRMSAQPIAPAAKTDDVEREDGRTSEDSDDDDKKKV